MKKLHMQFELLKKCFIFQSSRVKIKPVILYINIYTQSCSDLSSVILIVKHGTIGIAGWAAQSFIFIQFWPCFINHVRILRFVFSLKF